MSNSGNLNESGDYSTLLWENLITGNKQFKEQLQFVRSWLKSDTAKELGRKKNNIPPTLETDSNIIDKVISAPSTQASELLAEKKLSLESVYNTEKLIAFAEVTATIISIAESKLKLRTNDLGALIAQSAIGLAEKFKDANEFSFQELSIAFNHLLLTNSVNVDREATSNLRDISENIVSAAQAKTLGIPLSSSTIKGLDVWIGLGRMLFQVRGKGMGKKVVSQDATMQTTKNISELLAIITGEDQSVGSYSPILACNAALILPIQLYNLRNGTAEYISPEPE